MDPDVIEIPPPIHHPPRFREQNKASSFHRFKVSFGIHGGLCLIVFSLLGVFDSFKVLKILHLGFRFSAMIVCCFGLCLCLCCVLFSVVTIFPLFWFKVTVFAVVETTFSCLLLHVSFVIGNGMGLV